MAPPLRRLRALLLGAALGAPLGWVQGAAVVDIIGIVNTTPLPGIAGQGYTLLETAIATYGVWAFIGASMVKGLLLFVIVPAETVTPLYVVETASSPIHVAGIVVVGAAAITAANVVVYLIARLAGDRLVGDRESIAWRFVDWLVVEHGRTSMVLLRLVPWVGGWAAIPAGAARLNVRIFIVYSFLGFLLYEGLLGFAAYYGLKTGAVALPFIATLP